MDRFIKMSSYLVLSLALFPALVTAQLPDPGLTIDASRTAVVITDPQNDFLSPDGVTWGLVGASVEANGTVANIETVFQVAQEKGRLKCHRKTKSRKGRLALRFCR